MLFHVLGPLEVHADNGRLIEITAEKRRRLLTALLLKFDSWAAVELLVDAVWPGKPPASASGNLKTYVHHLRHQLPPRTGGEPRIETRPGYYRLSAGRSECDATAFADLVGRGRTAARNASPAAAVTHFQEALKLWRGEPFETLDLDQTRAEAALLRELRWSARDDLADALLAAGRAGEAISLLAPLASEDPLREPTWQRLLTAYHRADRRADGLAAYLQARTHLVDDLGVEPGAELQRLHRLLLEDQPAPEPPDHPATITAALMPDGAQPAVPRAPAAATMPSDGWVPPDTVSPLPEASASRIGPAPDAAIAGPAPDADHLVDSGWVPPDLVSAPPMWTPPDLVSAPPVDAAPPRSGPAPRQPDEWDEPEDDETYPRRRFPRHLVVSGATAILLLIGAVLFTLSDPPYGYGPGGDAGRGSSETPVNQALPAKSKTAGPQASATSGPKKAGSERNTKAPKGADPRYTGTPKLSFVSPSDGKVVSGTVTIRVKVSNPTRLIQVDFHYLTMMCEPDGYKEYLGNDKTPDANGVYEISFDTGEADDGCLDFGAVGLDKNGDSLHPPDGVYVTVRVNN
ncbi:MAG: BTAD domain-containing putative transcriptional regulator [Micromonosporaceae bacterium]